MSKKAHFIGICGKGMSAVAALLKERGYAITGTDTTCFPPVRDFLEAHNLWTHETFSRKNIADDVSLVVAGASASMDRTKNEEVDEAYIKNISVKTFPEILAELTSNKETIVVAGSFAKTTTTALIAWFLHHAGKDPSYFIGETMKQLPAHGHLGRSDVFVLEGDEYPTDSRTDPRAKFLVFKTDNIVLTSANHDHVNIFPTHKDYLKPFRELLARVPKSGLTIACSDNEAVRNLLREERMRPIWYGLDKKHNPDWTAARATFGETTTFDLVHRSRVVTTLSTQLLGMHNIQNIIGASAMVLEKKLITPEELQNALVDFKSVPRRLERKTNKSTIPVYEGYGTSYDKARSAIEAMVLHYPDKKLLIVFEPHTFSWRNREKLHWYDDVFKGADIILAYPPPSIGAGRHDQITHKEILERVGRNHNVIGIASEKEGLTKLESLLKGESSVLLLTSGNLGGLVQSVPKLAEKLFPKK